MSRLQDRLLTLLPRALRPGVQRGLEPDVFRDPRANMLRLAMQFAASCGVAGDYLEFGVYRGYSFLKAHRAAESVALADMRFHAFDSFAGLPALEGVDNDPSTPFVEGDFSSSRDAFVKALNDSGVKPNRVTVTEGWFADILTTETRQKLGLSRAAVIWVDCDLYSSTVPVLSFIRPLLQSGTVLAFDDWYSFKGRPDRGQQLAVSEWLESEPDVQLIDYLNFSWHGKSFIVNLRTQT